MTILSKQNVTDILILKPTMEYIYSFKYNLFSISRIILPPILDDQQIVGNLKSFPVVRIVKVECAVIVGQLLLDPQQNVFVDHLDGLDLVRSEVDGWIVANDCVVQLDQGHYHVVVLSLHQNPQAWR